MEELISVCNNPWCKATFRYQEDNIIEGQAPKMCPKCFRDSGSVTWSDKKYEGNIFDGTPHEFKDKIKTWY